MFISPGPAESGYAFSNSVDPDQLTFKEGNWSWSALFLIKYVNLCRWKLEVSVTS